VRCTTVVALLVGREVDDGCAASWEIGGLLRGREVDDGCCAASWERGGRLGGRGRYCSVGERWTTVVLLCGTTAMLLGGG
jgi:hypothetical protein